MYFDIEQRRSTTEDVVPLVMGVRNVTPDSFSDGGRYADVTAAFDQAMRMIAQGASVIDIGGESTRPGAMSVSVQQEIDRVVPVLERIAAASDILLSVDSSKAQVMSAALDAGAGMLNDVRSFSEPGALEVAVKAQVPICIMHMQGEPATMQSNPSYDHVVDEVMDFLSQRLAACVEAGVPRDKIMIDPGFGFGKTLQHNLQLFAHLDDFLALQAPILIGISRKSLFKDLLGRPIDQRLAGALAMTSSAVAQGVAVIRTHDVAETKDAVDVAYALAQRKRQ